MDVVQVHDIAPGLGRLYWLALTGAAGLAFAAFTWAVDRGIRAMNPAI